EPSFNWAIGLASIAIALIGIGVAALLYAKENLRSQQIVNQLKGLYTITFKKFYIDEIYLFVTHKILFNLVAQPVAWVDRNIVDGVVNGTAEVTTFFSQLIKKMQSGQLQLYIWFLTTGVIVLT